MKALRKSISLLLSLALLLSCLLTAYPVLAEDTTTEEAVTDDLVYSAVEDFSTANGNPNGVWKYQYRTTANPGNYYDLTATEENVWTAPGGSNIVLAAGNQVTSPTAPTVRFYPNTVNEEVVLTFTAPYTGVINLLSEDGGVFAPYNSQDGIRFEMIHNGVVVDSCYDLDNGYNANGSRYFTGTKAMVVKAGDTIRFAFGRNKHVDTRAFCSPKISYAKVCDDTTFNAYDDFSLTANPNGVWSYQWANAALTSFGNMALNEAGTMYTISNSSAAADIGSATSDLVTGNAAVRLRTHGLGNAVLTFTAPYSGTVNINMANGGVFAPAMGPSDGVGFKMLHNTTVLEDVKLDSKNNHPTTVSGYEGRLVTGTYTATVKAGDVIRFAVSRTGAADGGTYLNPEITYTDIVTDTFIATDDFSLEANPNGVWGYQYANAALTSFGNMALNEAGTMYTISNSSAAADIGSATSDLVTGNAVVRLRTHGLGNAVLTFTAPYSGTVNINMANGGVFAPSMGVNDGVGFKMLHNTTVLEDVKLDSKNSHPTTVSGFEGRLVTGTYTATVKAGDVIRFAVSRTGAADGSTYFAPVISYTEIVEPEAKLGKAYYVSSSSGDDSYNGLNEYSAWKTLAKLANVKLGEHDKVYLKAGDTWNEQLVLNSVNGTEDNPVIITSYGDGAQPVIDLGLVEDEATDTSELAKPVVLLNNAEGVEISNLAVTGSGIGIDLHYENDSNNKYVKIDNCTFTDITGFHQSDDRQRPYTDRYYIATAITVTYTNNSWAVTDPAVIGLYIEDCVSENCGALYCTGSSHLNTNEGGAVTVSGLYMKNCEMYENDYYGAFISSVNGGYIDNCLIDGCGDAEYYTPGTAGLLISTSNFSVINTEICWQQRGGVDYDGVAIDFEQSCNNVVVENCYFHDNTGAGFLIYDSKRGVDGANVNCTIQNNIFENNASEATGSTLIHNDRIVDIRIISGSGYSLSGSTIKDNVYINSRAGYEFIQDYQHLTPAVANVFENNVAVETATFAVSEELTAATAALYDGWNVSTNSADVRAGYAVQNGTLLVADTFRHLLATSEDTNWLHQYFLGGAWNDMEVTGEKNWGNATNGSFWSNDEITAGGTGSNGLMALVFVAPKSGRVRISFEQSIFLRQANGDSDGIYVSIANENRELLCDPVHVKAVGSCDAVIPAFYYNATAGEKIYIMVSKVEHSQFDSTRITPMVEYVNAFGSINADDEMDIRDLIALKNHIADESAAVTEFADINGDGAVAAADSVLLRRYLLGAFAQ